jgi:CheY-like chemotaxis protein
MREFTRNLRMMPDMNGWEVAHRIRADESLKDVRIVVLSALGPNRHDTRELKVVDAYVEKPFAPNHLLNEIRQALNPAA